MYLCPKLGALTQSVSTNPSLLASSPRQVAFLCKPPTMEQTDDAINTKTLILNADQKSLLFRSIGRYLHSCGFSKTLKKFRSEAGIEKDELVNSTFDLGEVFSKFLEMSNQVSKNMNNEKVQELQSDTVCTQSGEDNGKKKKSDKYTCDKSVDSKNNDVVAAHNSLDIAVKSKEKKRSKKTSNLVEQEEQVSEKVLHKTAHVYKYKDKKKTSDSNIESITDNSLNHPSKLLPGTTEENTKNVVFVDGKKETDFATDKKSKDKKRKKDKSSSDLDDNTDNIDSKMIEPRVPKEHVIDEDNKVSKKRKRKASEEDAGNGADEKHLEESKHIKTEETKRRKTEGAKEPQISSKLNSTDRTEEKAQKVKSIQVGFVESQKSSSEQINVQLNGNVMEDGVVSPLQKTIKKLCDVSTEPKTVKHFQRVKVDEVVFSDERLKDNSYWAKDGADTGYGAKAQEILGQVRGRGFRHEKTKKKRGSYRGGQIDLQSHSVKFNYSDEE